MRFFDRSWATGAGSERDSREAIRTYRKHIEAMLGTLPGPVAELASRVQLHDSLIRKVRVDRSRETLRLELLSGDQQEGYNEIDLTYAGVNLDLVDLELLAALSRDRRTELLYDEVDRLNEGTFEHRMLFWPTGELSIPFKSLEITTQSRGDRSLQYRGDPYEEVRSEEGRGSETRKPSAL